MKPVSLGQAPGPSEGPMLTLFTIPKPFKGHIGVIQRNAIRSWTLLRSAPGRSARSAMTRPSGCEIILFGDDEGTREVASEFGVRHVPDVARNEHGTPLVNDLFAKAGRIGTGRLLCYVNADIMLMNDFVRATAHVARRKYRFLMIGRRWDVDLNEPWDFERGDWASRLRTYVRERGRLYPKAGIDYFVFRPGLFGSVLPFAIGRTCWDNWLVFRALRRLAAVVDATAVVAAVHQNHDYGRLGTKEEVWDGVEARYNSGLMPGRRFTLDDATHALLPGDTSRLPRLAWRLGRTPHWLRRLTDLFSSTRLPVGALFGLVEATRPLRSALGLTLSAMRKKEKA